MNKFGLILQTAVLAVFALFIVIVMVGLVVMVVRSDYQGVAQKAGTREEGGEIREVKNNMSPWPIIFLLSQ